MENKKLFDITSGEKHDVISIGKYNLILILVDSEIKLLNDNKNVYKVYYSIFNQELNNLYRDFNAYIEFDDKDAAEKYYKELNLNLCNNNEEDINVMLNN